MDYDQRLGGSWPTLSLMVAAPFAAVAAGLYGARSAWLTVLLYHAQILLWALLVPRSHGSLRSGWSARWLLYLGLPAAMTAPLVFVLLPAALRADVHLAEWLHRYGLSGVALAAFVPYYGVIHPLLEQYHWDALRRDPRLRTWAHFLFALYHVPVLALLLRPGWVALCFALLVSASFTWARTRRQLGGLCVPALSHVIADLAMICAAYRLAAG